MKTVWMLTAGDLNDYDAPAPGAIFLTEKEVWEHVSKSLCFRVYDNGRVTFFTDYDRMYELPLGTDIDLNKCKVIEYPSGVTFPKKSAKAGSRNRNSKGRAFG